MSKYLPPHNDLTLADHWWLLQSKLDSFEFEWHVNAEGVVSMHAPDAKLPFTISIHDYQQAWGYLGRFHASLLFDEAWRHSHSKALDDARQHDPGSDPAIDTLQSSEDVDWKWYQEPGREGYLCKVISPNEDAATARIEIPFAIGTKSLFKTVPLATLSEVPEPGQT